MYAAKQGNAKIVSTLLIYNASLNIKDPDGRTALIFAAIGGHNKIVPTLLKNNTRMDMTDNKMVLQY